MQTLVGSKGKPGEGPFMILVIKTEASSILEAKFFTYNCPAAVACGQYLTEFVQDKTIDAARQIDEPHIIAAIGQMPLGREHCPGLGVAALQDALRQFNLKTDEAIALESVGTSEGEGS